MKQYKTKVEKLGVPVGTKVTFDEKESSIGATGKLLCTVPIGGGLFYSEDELELVLTYGN